MATVIDPLASWLSQQAAAAGASPDIPTGGDAGIAYAAQLNAQKFLRDQYLTGDVDQDTGAPIGVRAKVETQPDPASRLATLKTYAPDATALPGTNNFVYTDPASGQRTLYNPRGWSLGDVTMLEQPAASLLGGVAGGALGSAAGGPAGGAVGYGVGSTVGQEALAQVGQDLLGARDVRTPGERAAQGAVQSAVNSAIGAVVPAIARGVFTPAPSVAAQAAAQLDKSGVAPGLVDTLPAGVASGSPTLQAIDAALAQTPTGRGTILSRYAATNQKVEAGVGNVADMAVGAPPSGGSAAVNPETFGGTINNIATQMGNQWETTRNQLDDAVKNAVGASTPTDIAPLAALRTQLQSELTQGGPQTLGRVYQPAIDELDKIIGDAGDTGAVPFGTLQKARTMIGQTTYGANQAAGEVHPAAQGALDQVYGTLGQVIGDKATAAGPQAAQAYSDYMDAVRNYRADPATGRADLSTGAAVEALQNPALGANYLMQLAKSTAPRDQAMLANFVNNATPDQRGQIASGMIARLGIDPQGNFDVLRFARNWNGLTDGAKSALFAGPNADLADHLDNLATVGSQVRDSLNVKAFSNTPMAVGIFKALGAAAAAAKMGEPGAAAGIVGAGLVGPYAAARMLQSAPFVKWASGALADTSPGAFNRAVTSLPAVAAADPSVRDYVTALHSQMAAGQGASQ